MDIKRCCVCGEVIEETPFYHGGRLFCKTHHEKIHKDSKGLWVSNLFSIGGLLILVLIAVGLEKLFGDSLGKTGLILVSGLIALVPPALWLTVFYRQDRLEPEPKAHIAKLLVLGALVQQAIYMPLTNWLLPESLNKTQTGIGQTILFLILIAGFQEILKLLTTRYGIFATTEFDEKIDGIIYGSAVGLGFALMFNFQYILTAGGPMLSASAANAVVSSLAQASFGGLTGYFLAVTKFEKKAWWWLPSGLLMAIAGNALTVWLLENITRRGFRVNYLLGLIPAAIISILVFSVLLTIIKRNITLAEGDASEIGAAHDSPDTIKKQIQIEGSLVWAIAAIVLIGAITLNLVSNQLQKVEYSDKIVVAYPSGWSGNQLSDGSFAASEMIIPGQLPTILTVSTIPLIMPVREQTVEEELNNMAASWTMKSAASYTYYVPLDTTFRMVDGKPAAVIEYMFIQDKAFAGSDSRPVSGRGFDVLVLSDEEQICITLSTGKDSDEDIGDLLYRILDAVRLS